MMKRGVLVSLFVGCLAPAGATVAQEKTTQDERPKIRVLGDPKDISSFYRRGGSPYRYRFTPRESRDSFSYPTQPHPISSYYRGDESFVEPVFDPPGYIPYYDRALIYRVYRPGFFLGGLPPPCPCDSGRN